jgi:hypothetical protein
LGNVFDLLDFASASGSFNTLNLPSLSAGLAWNTSNLLTTGQISVVMSGAGSVQGANVPEPCSLGLLVACGCFAVIVRRRSVRR